MKLRYSTTSPFARKAWLIVLERGLAEKVEIVTTNPWVADTDLPADNPLCKVPALVLGDDGSSLYDSPVICEYLDSLHGAEPFLPPTGPERWEQLKLQALADGLMDAAVAIRVETAMRPEDKRWPHWVERQDAALARGLDALDTQAEAWGDAFRIGQVAVVALLGYLDFRGIGGDWRAGRPHLTEWFARASQRPAVAETTPRD